MSAGQLVIVTGKGGVGKTTVAAALGAAAAKAGKRALVVEIARPGRLASVLDAAELDHQPAAVRTGLDAVALDEEHCLASFIEGLMPLKLLSRRLLGSSTFRVICAAVPGILEAALLARVVRWTEERGPDGPRYHLVILDAPASGHSLPLLNAPRTLATLASIGPLGDRLRELENRLHDPARTHAAVVAIPQDWAVAEGAELYRTLRDDLALPLLPPLLNQTWPRRFRPAEEHAIDLAEAENSIDPELLFAARLFRAEAARSRAAARDLKAGLGEKPIELPFVIGDTMALEDLEPLVQSLGKLVADAG